MTIITGGTPPTSAQGLDVSNFQGQFDWAEAKKGYPQLAFGIFKATQSIDFTDADAQHNHDGIGAAGLHRGSYHFMDPGQPGAKQALFFVQALARLGADSSQMLFLDNETASISGPGGVAKVAGDFMHELDQLAPHNPRGVYTFIDFAKEGNCAGLEDYPLWLAYPALSSPASPPPWHNWTFWQWGTRNGIDADAFNGSPGELQGWIESYLPQTRGPYRHTLGQQETLADVALARNTTVGHLAQVTAGALHEADLDAMFTAVETSPAPGLVYYTTNP